MGFLCAGAGAQGIYTCVDAKGRRLTADRPIAECTDREQRELTKDGMLKRKIGPTLTAEERAVEEEKNRLAIEEKNRQAEERKRERALLVRYPDKAAHDKERAIALAVIDETIKVANTNTEHLVTQRRKLDLDVEFFKGNPDKAPLTLRRQLEENETQLQAQKRFVANQEEEKKRINTRFDEELVKLRALWAQRVSPPSATAKK
nr:DUF4124 domain-containing protein [Caenimonas aquaedulcis]